MAEELIRLGPYCVEGAGCQLGRTMTNDLPGLADGPTAIVSGSDMLAAAGLQALGEKGMRVRADVWIIGHDDTMGEILTAG